MKPIDVLRSYCTPCEDALNQLGSLLDGFDLNHWLAWVQLAGAVIGILWIVYQFNQLRRISEQKFEDYLEAHLQEKKLKLLAERDQYLSTIQRRVRAPAIQKWWRAILVVLAQAAHVVGRALLLSRRRTIVEKAHLALESGDLGRAKVSFESGADDLIRKARAYGDQAQVKHLEAMNALLYAGRLAGERGESKDSIRLMERLLALNPVDLDARLIVGEQYVAAGSFTAALREFIKLAELALESSNPKLEARAHELQAKVYEQQSLPGKALEALKHSLEIRLGLRDDQAVAETLEALGDLYARRTRPARRAAVDCYQRSIEKFRECRNGVAVRRVQRMRDALVGVNQPEDTWASLLLRRVGNSMLKGAELLRVPVHTT